MSEGSITCVKTRPNLSRIIPTEIAEMFGNPPVPSLEDRQAYDQLMAQLALEWKPRNITEWMFVRDSADISWEIFRHRRAIANTFAISFKQALQRVFYNELDDDYERAKYLACAWFEGPEEQQEVKSELAKYDLSPEVIVAQCYSIKGDELDKLHRLLALAEARRSAITRNFNEYRAMCPLQEKPVVDSKEIALVPDSA